MERTEEQQPEEEQPEERPATEKDQVAGEKERQQDVTDDFEPAESEEETEEKAQDAINKAFE